MLPQVVLVMRTPFEGQRAIGADKGTHSSVDTLMDLEQRGAFEGFAAVLTFIRLLS